VIHISRGADLTLPAPARMPFVDSVALAAVTGLPKRTAREALRRLCEHGYVGTVGNAIPDNSRRTIHVRASAHRLCDCRKRPGFPVCTGPECDEVYEIEYGRAGQER